MFGTTNAAGLDRRYAISVPYFGRLQPRPEPRRLEPIYATAIAAGLWLFQLWGLKPLATGLEHVPTTGGAVLAMTRFGYLEFALVEWALWKHNRRRIRFLINKDAFDKPLLGPLLHGMGHIAVDMTPGADAYAKAVEALKGNELVGVFPEAGASASFTVHDFKTGAAQLAVKAGAPLIPIAVWGGHRLLTRSHKVPNRDRIGVAVHFEFGAPIKMTTTEDARAVTDELCATTQRMVDRLQRSYPVDGAGLWWQPRHLGGSAPAPVEAGGVYSNRDTRHDGIPRQGSGPANFQQVFPTLSGCTPAPRGDASSPSTRPPSRPVSASSLRGG